MWLNILFRKKYFIRSYYIIMEMEGGRVMLLHSAIIGLLLYIIMVYLLQQKQSVAENRSILLSAVILIYMIVFGHGMPTSINKNL